MRCELVFGAQGPHQVGLGKRDGRRGHGRREAHAPRFVLLRSEGLGRQEHIGESEHHAKRSRYRMKIIRIILWQRGVLFTNRRYIHFYVYKRCCTGKFLRIVVLLWYWYGTVKGCSIATTVVLVPVAWYC